MKRILKIMLTITLMTVLVLPMIASAATNFTEGFKIRTTQSISDVKNGNDADGMYGKLLGKIDTTSDGNWSTTLNGVEWQFNKTSEEITIKFTDSYDPSLTPVNTVVVKSGNYHTVYTYNPTLQKLEYVVVDTSAINQIKKGKTSAISHISFYNDPSINPIPELTKDEGTLKITKQLGVYINDSITGKGIKMSTLSQIGNKNWFEYTPIPVGVAQTENGFTTNLIAGNDNKVVGTMNAKLSNNQLTVSYQLKDGLTFRSSDVAKMDVVANPNDFTTSAPGQLTYAFPNGVKTIDVSLPNGVTDTVFVYLHLGAIGVMDISLYDDLFKNTPFTVTVQSADLDPLSPDYVNKTIQIFAGKSIELVLPVGKYNVTEQSGNYTIYSGNGQYTVDKQLINNLTIINGLDSVPSIQ